MKRLLIPVLLISFSFAMDMTEDEQILFDWVNQYREFMWKTTLEYNEKLHLAAQDQCQYMSDTLDYWHKRKNGSQPRDRAESFWYNRTSIRENIARQYNRWPIYVLFWFMNSPSHKVAMLKYSVKDLWISHVWDYWCMLLGKEE